MACSGIMCVATATAALIVAYPTSAKTSDLDHPEPWTLDAYFSDNDTPIVNGYEQVEEIKAQREAEKKAEREIDKRSESLDVASWLKEVESIVRIHSDPVQRTIVCRVPYTDLAVTSLVQVTGIPRVRIMSAINSLKAAGLVNLTNNQHSQWIVVPASEDARKRMNKLARSWCTNDDECAVKR